MTTATLTAEQQEAALAIVAEWFATKGYGVPQCPDGLPLDCCLRHPDRTDCNDVTFGPAPTGLTAAVRGLGPQLIPDWDWPSAGPTPSIVLEGGPYDWAYEIDVNDQLRPLGIFAEPYAGYALCLYPAA